ncbi:hypothetical protein ACI65C_013799 [Semiaphis heraclei]
MENQSKPKRKGYMTIPQKQRLIDLMSEEHALRSGKFSPNKLLTQSGMKLQILNAKEWKRAWADLKTKTKGKHCLIKKYANKTGGGPSCSSNLNEIDEQILALINPTTITGHNNVAESNVDFSFHNDIDINFEIEEGDEIVLDTQHFETDEVVEDINHSLLLPFNKENKLDSKDLDNSVNKIDNISTSIITEKHSKKFQKHRSNAAIRLQKSVTATEKLADIGREKLLIKKRYYDKKLLLLEKQTELLSRQVLSYEKQTSVLEQIQGDLKSIASNTAYFLM